MNKKHTSLFDAPYLLFIGDIDSPIYAKTAMGLIQWCPQLVAGQLRFKGNLLDLGAPDMGIDQAVAAGVKSLVLGVAPVGGKIGDSWLPVLIDAAKAGLDIVSGLHVPLNDWAELTEAVNHAGTQLIEIRQPPADIPVGSGVKRSGKRLLTVGTDCSVGKKYTALSMTRAMQDRGIEALFRATGQTGIMIAGEGIPIDAVVSDFVSGAAELISPSADAAHWDIIEGQGSLFNPSYAGVSLGLLHGSQPDALIVCHDALRDFIGSCPHLPLPTVKECIDLNIRCAALTNSRVKCIGVSVNTSKLPDTKRVQYLEQLSEKTGLPCIDPLIDGCDVFVNQLLDENVNRTTEVH